MRTRRPLCPIVIVLHAACTHGAGWCRTGDGEGKAGEKERERER